MKSHKILTFELDCERDTGFVFPRDLLEITGEVFLAEGIYI